VNPYTHTLLVVYCKGNRSASVRVWADSFVLDRLADQCRFLKAGTDVSVFNDSAEPIARFTVPRRVNNVPSF
jgi:hypothetical protein